jgi:hypothetical protein
MYFGIQYVIDGDNLGGVRISQVGDSDNLPVNAVTRNAFSMKDTASKYLKIISDSIVEKSQDEKDFVDFPIKYKKYVDNVWVKMTDDEILAVNAADQAAIEAAQAQAVADMAVKMQAYQDNKPADLKYFENRFMDSLDNLTGALLQMGVPDIPPTGITPQNSTERQVSNWLLLIPDHDAATVLGAQIAIMRQQIAELTEQMNMYPPDGSRIVDNIIRHS